MSQRYTPQDRRPAHDVRGAAPPSRETLGEYFDFGRFPEKAAFRVTRLELLAILEQHFRVVEAHRTRGFLRRVWRFLKRPVGSPITDETGVASPEVNTR